MVVDALLTILEPTIIALFGGELLTIITESVVVNHGLLLILVVLLTGRRDFIVTLLRLGLGRHFNPLGTAAEGDELLRVDFRGLASDESDFIPINADRHLASLIPELANLLCEVLDGGLQCFRLGGQPRIFGELLQNLLAEFRLDVRYTARFDDC